MFYIKDLDNTLKKKSILNKSDNFLLKLFLK